MFYVINMIEFGNIGKNRILDRNLPDGYVLYFLFITNKLPYFPVFPCRPGNLVVFFGIFGAVKQLIFTGVRVMFQIIF